MPQIEINADICYYAPMEIGEAEKAENELTHRNAKEWARISGISYRTILSEVRAGSLEAIQPGGSTGTIYISSKAFEDWRDGCRVKVKLPDRSSTGGGIRRPNRSMAKKNRTSLDDFRLESVSASPFIY